VWAAPRPPFDSVQTVLKILALEVQAEDDLRDSKMVGRGGIILQF
jgi:hypothetical protein